MFARIAKVLETLEGFYGAQETPWPTHPYLYLVWLHCGYPASDERCSKGWHVLQKAIGVKPSQILDAPLTDLAEALAAGGTVPEDRARRLKEVATRVAYECGGDLGAALTGSVAATRKFLKKFPNIADPGVDRILLFAGVSPTAAAPSNCPHVIVRIMSGREPEDYSAAYKEAQRAIQNLPENFAARKRAFLLLKRHGQELCKRANPKCDRCPISELCAFNLQRASKSSREQRDTEGARPA
jgi:endonuclease-3